MVVIASERVSRIIIIGVFCDKLITSYQDILLRQKVGVKKLAARERKLLNVH